MRHQGLAGSTTRPNTSQGRGAGRGTASTGPSTTHTAIPTTTLYGVARELLSNVARHAEARTVRLRLHDDGEIATLEVQDDGVGMDPAVISHRVKEGHIGVASHRARIETVGGAVDFRPADRGSRVRYGCRCAGWGGSRRNQRLANPPRPHCGHQPKRPASIFRLRHKAI